MGLDLNPNHVARLHSKEVVTAIPLPFVMESKIPQPSALLELVHDDLHGRLFDISFRCMGNTRQWVLVLRLPAAFVSALWLSPRSPPCVRCDMYKLDVTIRTLQSKAGILLCIPRARLARRFVGCLLRCGARTGRCGFGVQIRPVNTGAARG